MILPDLIDLEWYAKYAGRSFSSGEEAADHYVSAGEANGLWPNQLFDPRFYRQNYQVEAGQNALEHFARIGSARDLQPCAYFVPAWYRWQNPDYLSSGEPILHYLQVGSRQRRDPSPWVDMTLLLRLRPDLENGAAAIWAASTDTTVFNEVRSAIIVDAGDLVQRQSAMLADITVNAAKVSPTPVHGRNLVYVQAGPGAPFWKWFDSARPRDWDLLVNVYSDPFEQALLGEHCFEQKGTKFTAMANIWRHPSQVLNNYDYVWFLDDDIEVEFADVSAFFAALKRYDLHIAQPSLTEDSSVNWPIFKRVPGSKFRNLNGVEIMMPAMSRDARIRWFPYLMLAISGYGLDLFFSSTYLRCGIVDTIEVAHRKPISHESGAYYENLRRYGINAKAELWRIMQGYQLSAGFSRID